METVKPRGVGNIAQPKNMAMNPEICRHVSGAIEGPAFLHDTPLRVLLANGACCRAAGVTLAQALGKPDWEISPPGTGPLPRCKDAYV